MTFCRVCAMDGSAPINKMNETNEILRAGNHGINFMAPQYIFNLLFEEEDYSTVTDLARLRG